MLVWAEWCLGLFNSSHGEGKTKASFITWFPLTKMELNQTENSHWGDALWKHLSTSEADRQKSTQTQTQSLPKLLCVGETGLGDRLGEPVSMLWVIW